MTAEGILARGKANYEAGKFLDNSETLAYEKTLPSTKDTVNDTVKDTVKDTVNPKNKSKEAKDAPPTK